MQGMLFSLMILGAFLKKKGIITDEGKRVIADLVIFVTLPCSIIESFEVELSMDILKSSAQALLVSCMVQVTCYILNMVLYPGVGEEKKKVLKYATMASNAGILGNPVAEGIFGSMGLFYASFYLIPQRTAMWSLGMTYFTKAPDRKTLIKKICTHPCIVSVFIGFVLMLLSSVLYQIALYNSRMALLWFALLSFWPKLFVLLPSAVYSHHLTCQVQLH